MIASRTVNDTPPSSEQFPYRVTIPARWGDADMLGHINNVAYYRYFEAVVVDFIATPCGIDWLCAPVIPFAAESRCRFLRPLRFPGTFVAGLRVARVGTSSVLPDFAWPVSAPAASATTWPCSTRPMTASQPAATGSTFS